MPGAAKWSAAVGNKANMLATTLHIILIFANFLKLLKEIFRQSNSLFITLSIEIVVNCFGTTHKKGFHTLLTAVLVV